MTSSILMEQTAWPIVSNHALAPSSQLGKPKPKKLSSADAIDTESRLIKALLEAQDKQIVFSLPDNPQKKYRIRLQEDFVTPGVFHAKGTPPKYMLYVESVPIQAGDLPDVIAMATGIFVDNAGILHLEWIITFDYPEILRELERFKKKQRRSDWSLRAAIAVYIIFGTNPEYHAQIKFLYAYLDTKLGKDDELWARYLTTAPQSLRGQGIGNALAEFLTSFAPVNSKLQYLVAHKSTKEALSTDVAFPATPLGKWWKNLGFVIHRALGDITTHEGTKNLPGYVLIKQFPTPIRTRWEDSSILGPYTLPPPVNRQAVSETGKAAIQIILIVDDNPDIRLMVGDMLENAGYRVVRAVNGQEGLSLVSPDIALVISDTRMPVMDGPTMIQAIRKNYPDLPIILMSNDPSAGYTLKLPFLRKPFGMDDLLKKVASLIHAVQQGSLDSRMTELATTSAAL